jgi:hypothetical protein
MVAGAGTATGTSNEDVGESVVPALDPDDEAGPEAGPDTDPDARVARRRPIDDELRLLGRTSIDLLFEVLKPH